VRLLRSASVALVCCHGYKPNLVGLLAARSLGIPIIAVSRGWTGETLRVRFYEALDRFALRWMDQVVCVSHSQAHKVVRAGVPLSKVRVIPNAIHTARFAEVDQRFRERLRQMFSEPPSLIVGAAGRLSPEKGFDVLIDAAALVTRANPSTGFVLFGDGALRQRLVQQAEAKGLNGRFVFAGFRSDLDKYLPHLDLVVLPSRTEGLPNVALEAHAAGVPIVATAVGGTPDVVQDRVTGYLVPSEDPGTMARRVQDLLVSEAVRRDMGARGRERVRWEFSFDSQARAYRSLFEAMMSK